MGLALALMSSAYAISCPQCVHPCRGLHLAGDWMTFV
jgi:hypothetical protein